MKDAAELDLGITPEKTKELSVSVPEKPESPSYPELTFRGKHADLFRQKYGNCAPGDEYETTMRLRVKSSSDGESEYDKRIEFCAVAIIGDVVEEESTKEDEKPAAKPARKLSKKTEVAAAY